MAENVDIDEIAGEDTTFTDDLMPNEGSAFVGDEPDQSSEHDTEVEANNEANMILGSLPVMDHLDQWFKDEIGSADSIAAAKAIVDEYKVSFDNAAIALDVVAKVLEIKRVNMKTLKEIYIDRK